MTFQRTCNCGECEKCKKRVYMRGWTERNAERLREYWRVRHAANPQPRPPRDPMKRKAQHAVYTEVRAGRLVPQPCEVCGGKGEAHHDDYERPLDVRWLCRRHHALAHQEVL